MIIHKQIVYKKTSDLQPYEKNPRKNDDAVPYVAESIKEFNFQSPIIIDKDGTIVCGHTRWKAAKKLGLKEVPCIIADDLTDEQIKAFRLADNRVGELAEWDSMLLADELDGIFDIDMSAFGFGTVDSLGDDLLSLPSDTTEDEDVSASVRHNVFENQELRQFPATNYYGIPSIRRTHTSGDKLLRFCDFNQVDDHQNWIAHFYYDDYKFINAWRQPNQYLDKLRQFKAVISPDFSLYTDFPRTLQILSCYRRQWCGAYWQEQGIDVIPDVVWGDKDSYDYCFLGIPKHSTVAVSAVGVTCDKDWNGVDADMFRDGYNEMMSRLEPETIIFYGTALDGLEGNIIRVPSFYEERRKGLPGRRS